MHWKVVLLKNKNVVAVRSNGFDDQVYVDINESHCSRILLVKNGKNIFDLFLDGILISQDSTLKQILNRIDKLAKRWEDREGA